MTGREWQWWDDSDAWSEGRRQPWAEADRAAARRLEVDAVAARVAGRARAVRWWAGFAVGLAVSGLLLALSLRTGG